jgi:acyl-CoA reductase-like NAD-dependent aldehyde dehydrogenase
MESGRENMTTKTHTYYGNYIDGRWQETEQSIPVFNKYNHEEIGRIGNATREQVDEAITSSSQAFHQIKLSPVARYEILMRAVDLFKARKEELASMIVKEGGKVLKDARAEIDRGIQTFIASAEEAKRITGTGIPLGQPGFEQNMAFSVRVPVGIIGAITPFNFPFNLVAHKVGPALAAGNAVVLKPAEKTPFTACMMAGVLTEAGLPAGYLNIINGWGHESGKYLLEDERIAMYSFTGSPEVGRIVKNQTGIRKVTLELGNNSPNIVHYDVQDLDQAANLLVRSGYSNSGQACISVQRIYVHHSIYDEFVEKAVRVAKSLNVGDPNDESTDIGPMISEDAAKRVEQWVNEAVSEGAVVACGGKREQSIYHPTLVTNVKPHMKIVCEEVFGPVISMIPYENIDEAFKLANDTRFGLQIGLFTSNLQIFNRAVTELNFGGVIINNVSTYRPDVMPYGGIKDSGVGKEGPHAAIQEMTDERIVVIHNA